MTANYVGRVSKTGCDMITYTAIFGGTEIRPEPEPMPILEDDVEQNAEPETDADSALVLDVETPSEPQKRSMAWIPVTLVLVAAAGGAGWYVWKKRGGAFKK